MRAAAVSSGPRSRLCEEQILAQTWSSRPPPCRRSPGQRALIGPPAAGSLTVRRAGPALEPRRRAWLVPRLSNEVLSSRRGAAPRGGMASEQGMRISALCSAAHNDNKVIKFLITKFRVSAGRPTEYLRRGIQPHASLRRWRRRRRRGARSSAGAQAVDEGRLP